jgi:hypothetical protein
VVASYGLVPAPETELIHAPAGFELTDTVLIEIEGGLSAIMGDKEPTRDGAAGDGFDFDFYEALGGADDEP